MTRNPLFLAGTKDRVPAVRLSSRDTRTFQPGVRLRSRQTPATVGPSGVVVEATNTVVEDRG